MRDRRAYQKAWREKHKERLKLASKEWRKKHPTAHREWRSKNRDKMIVIANRWRSKNKFVIKLAYVYKISIPEARKLLDTR